MAVWSTQYHSLSDSHSPLFAFDPHMYPRQSSDCQATFSVRLIMNSLKTDKSLYDTKHTIM
jgi:hypothetical protein